MDDTYSFPYHYGEEADQYTFYRIPKILFIDPIFNGLSCEAKLLYGLLLDRMQLSIRNHWMDEEGRVFIYFAQDQIAEKLGCGLKKAASLLNELGDKKGIGLITRVRQGLGKPDRIYVRKCISPDVSKQRTQIRQKGISRYANPIHTDLPDVLTNDTEKKDTEWNDTEFIPFYSADEQDMDFQKRMEREQYLQLIKENIGYEYLVIEYQPSMLDEIVGLILDVVCSEQKYIKIGGDKKPMSVVKSQFLKLDIEHIRFVLHCMKENTSKIMNIRQYLLAVLYNAPLTISNYYSALVQHDMYGGSV